MDFLYFISAVGGLVVFICFCVLCSNVADIKKIVNSNNDYENWKKIYYRHKIFGNTPAALHAYEEMISIKMLALKNKKAKEEKKRAEFEELKTLYPTLEALGGKWPAYESIK